MNTPQRGEPENRYPASFALVRHAESKYNALKNVANGWEEAAEFKKLFNEDFYDGNKPRAELPVEVLEGRWPTPALRAAGMRYFTRINDLMQGVSDYDTPITDAGLAQAQKTGERIADVIPKPDIIYVSPYKRTRQTLEAILEGAPKEWRDVPTWENESIREQEHGMNTVFNDWKLSYVFDPMEMLHSIKQGEYSYRYKGGESRFDVRNRTSRFIGRMRRKHEGENVLAVTHHLTILATIGELMHWSREEFMEWDEKRKPPNSSVTIFEREEHASRTGRDRLKFDPAKYGMKLYERE